jgi:AraC-like DNA-binding protein
MKSGDRLAVLQDRMRSRAEVRPARGRPALPVAATTVRQLASVGLTDKGIAGACGCSVKTLHRRFTSELGLGRARITGHVKIELVERAFDGDRRALLLLAKRMKWDT